MFRPLSLIALTTYATLLVAVPTAWANGDPPSNVLLNSAVYLPGDAAPPKEARRLTETVDAAADAGYDVKVALVQSVRDLGNIPQYWGQPQAYADHLADGIGFAWRGDLLIVMPGGLGVASAAQADKKKAAIAKITPASQGTAQMADAGDRAVRALAKAAGRPVGSGGSGSVLPALLVLGALLLVGGGAAAARMRAGADAPGGESERKEDLARVDERPDEV